MKRMIWIFLALAVTGCTNTGASLKAARRRR